MARGLSDTDIDGLRQQLADGKRPRVALSGPHFPVGATGTVIRVGRPEDDGPDYLRVRVKVDNMTDELAFSPAELTVPGRATRGGGKPSARTAPAGNTPAGNTPAGNAPAGRAAPDKAAAGKAGGNKAVADKAVGGKAVNGKAAPRKPATTGEAAPRSATSSAAAAQPTAPTPASPASRPATPRPARRTTGPAQKVSFTVSSAGAAWSVSATRGSKGIVKNVSLTPGQVAALTEVLDQPALTDAVAAINSVALAEAQARAEQLRSELSQLEAVLAGHRHP